MPPAPIKFSPQEFFGDAAWAMLLELFVAEQMNTTQSEREVCEKSSIPRTTALRWLSAMEQAGFLWRAEGPANVDVRLISLTEKGRVSVTSILALSQSGDSAMEQDLRLLRVSI